MPSKSKQQQKFMGMVHSLQKGDMKSSDASPELKKVAKSMDKTDAKDYASTSHKGLPKKVKQEIARKLKEYATKMGKDHMGGDSIPSQNKGGLRDNDGYDNVDYNRDMPMDESSDVYSISRMLGTGQQSTQDFIDDNKIDVKKLESYIKKLSPSKKIIIKDIINGSTDTRLSTIKKGLIKQVKESIEENFPSNWLQGRVSDYHTKKGTTPRDTYDKTNFNTKHSGQEDLEDDELEESGKDKSEKNYKDWKKSNVNEENPCWDGYKQVGMKTKGGKQVPNCVKESVNESSDTLEMLQLLNKAMSTMPNSPKQKEIIKKLNALRVKNKMQPLKEWGAISQGYHLEPSQEDKLYGTPEDKMAIDEVGVFPIRAFLQDLIPGNIIKTTTPQDKERLKSTIKDLIFTLNKFWKQHDIPYRVKESVIDEAVDKDDLKNAKNRLKDPHTIEDIEYSKTRSGDKFVKIIYKKKYVPGKMMDTGPHFVSVFYTDEKDLQNIGKALKLKLKESVSEVAKRDYKAEYKKFQSSDKSKKYRAELNKYNRDKGTYGNGDGKDASHKGGKIVGFETESKNRGRREKSRLKKK